MESDSNILVPFSAFYKTIETFLDSSIRSVVMNAEKNERLDEFDVEVLKLLFLVKYVKEIKANINNLATLLVDNIEASHRDLTFKVQESLKKLIRETLVQKNGEEYVFLTNDEQDVNKEIKNMNVDNGEIIQKVGEIIFDDIYKDNKYNYSKKYMFTFNKMVDDRTRGPQNNEIGVKITTANFDLVSGGGTTQSELKHLSIRENNVIVNISKDVNYLDEIEYVLKIDAYLRLKSGSKSSNAIEDIKSKKIREREDRVKRATLLIEEALRSAEIYVNGSLLDIKEKGALDRINEGLKALIDSKYNKINYVKEFKESTKDLFDIMDTRLNQMSLIDSDPNRLAIDEVRNHIETSTTRNLQVTVKSIISKFSNAPYGWKEIDIQVIIVTLFKKQDIKVVLNNEVISPNNRDVVNYITKKDYMDRVVLKTREKVPNKYIEAVKDLNKDLFGFSSMPSDEDGMMSAFKDQCKRELQNIEIMLKNFSLTSRYPGEEVLKEGMKIFKEVVAIKDTLEFFKSVYDLESDFLDYVDKIDNIKGFFFKKENGNIDIYSKGEQRIIFDNALEKINNYEENKEYIVNDEINNIIEEIKSILRMKEPYSKIPTIPLLIEKYNNEILSLLEKQSIPVLDFIRTCKNEVMETLNSYDFNNNFGAEINEEFNSLISRTEKANNFAVLSSMSDRADNLKLKWIKKIVEEDEKQKRIKVNVGGGSNTNPNYPISQPGDDDGEGKPIINEPPVSIKTKTLSMRELVKGQKVIKNTSDIEDVIENLRKKLTEELEKDTIINLI